MTVAPPHLWGTPAQAALLGYMEGQSEMRWCAGWYSGLQLMLLGDRAYEWLVEQAGGWWEYKEVTLPPKGMVGGDPWGRQFVEGTLDELKNTHTKEEQ